MTDREELTALIMAGAGDCFGKGGALNCSKLADYLLEHGVIVLPCKVGDTVFTTYHGSLSVYRVTEFILNDFLWAKLHNSDYSREYESILVCLDFSFNEFVFLTREEAEKALKEREKN